MLTFVLCAMLMLGVLGWMLRINSLDRKRFEKELEEEFADELDDR